MVLHATYVANIYGYPFVVNIPVQSGINYSVFIIYYLLYIIYYLLYLLFIEYLLFGYELHDLQSLLPEVCC